MAKFTRVINIEGTDGVGKASVTQELYSKLPSEITMKTAFPRYNCEPGKAILDLLNGDYGNPILIDPKLMSLPYIIDRREEYSQLQDSANNLDRFGHKEAILICDRSWLSNLCYQGTKVYFHNILTYLESILENPLFVAKDDATALRMIQKLKDDDPSKFGGHLFANIIIIPSSKKERMRLYHGGIGRAFNEIPRSFFNDTSKELNDFIHWLYRKELVGTEIENAEFDNIYLTRKDGIVKIVSDTFNAMVETRSTLDIFESNINYRILVSVFSHILTENLIPDLKWDDIPPMRKGFTVIKQDTGKTTDEIKTIVNDTTNYIIEYLNLPGGPNNGN